MSDRSGDALVELTDAEMCSGGPVKTLVDCRCAPEHRRVTAPWNDGVVYGNQYQGAAVRDRRATPVARETADHVGR